MAPLISVLILLGLLLGGLTSGRANKGNTSMPLDKVTQPVAAPEPNYAYGAALTGLLLLVQWTQRTRNKG